MHFANGYLVVRRSDAEFWGENDHRSYKPAWWFPGNWNTGYREKLKEMQSKHFDI